MKRWLFTLLAAVAVAAPVPAGGRDRPNVVLILADDLGIGDLGCYNRESKIPTRAMDRLAAQGMRFGDAHTPSSVCSPTRYGLLTGRYCWRTSLKGGVLQGYSPLLVERDRLTLASLLRRAGYHTACIGKWHLGLGTAKKTDYGRPLAPGPNAVGFDYYFGIPASLDMEPYVYVENDRPVEAPTNNIAASKHRRQGGDGFWRAGPIAPHFHHIDVLPKIADKAVSYLEERSKEDRPFFLYFPLTAPHTPWLPTEKYQGRSRVGHYGDFVLQVDDVVGRVLDALDRLKLSDNTLVIFTSDNGSHWPETDVTRWGHRANWLFRGQKADAWEGGHRVPFLVRWPGRVRPGGTSDEVICLTDVFATVAEVVGQDFPADAGEDSYSLLPLLLGRQRTGPLREATVHHSMTGTFAVRQGDWVLIEGLGSGGFTAPRVVEPTPGGPKGQLYNLTKDVGQQHNVYLAHPDVVERLTGILQRYREQGYSRPRGQS